MEIATPALNTIVGQNITKCINYTVSTFYSTGYNIKYHQKAHSSFIELHYKIYRL